MCGLIGRNGAGKTTFMRAIMGALDARMARWNSTVPILSDAPAHQRAHMGIGFMPEDRRLVPQLTSEENIMLPTWTTKVEKPRNGWNGSTS